MNMKVDVISFETQKPVESLTLQAAVFDKPFSEPLAHQAVTTYLTRARRGTSKQKLRSEVSGGGRKPFRQKGTGRARAGSTRSPIWVGGGKTHAAVPKDYTTVKFPKKMYRAAMRCIWSELMRQGCITVVDAITFETRQTKPVVEALTKFNLQNDRTLIITSTVDDNLFYSARNLPNVALYDAQSVDPVVLVGCKHVLITSEALKAIEENLGE